MPRIYEDKALARVCVRLWTDDMEYLQSVSRTEGTIGFNMLVRQIVHSYVVHVRDKQQQQLDKLPNDDLKDLPKIELQFTDLDFEPEEEPEPKQKGQVVEITL